MHIEQFQIQMDGYASVSGADSAVKFGAFQRCEDEKRSISDGKFEACGRNTSAEGYEAQ